MTVNNVLPVSITPVAIAHIVQQLSNNPSARGIRLTIKNSGCSGYKYLTQWATNIEPDDIVFSISGFDVVVKEQHLPIVAGIEIDYVTQGVNSAFQFNNPNATAECGCGESFTIE
jgi:iron-sulfur cluster assembly accessory protein